MLVTMVGSPGSGKTTTIAMVFAMLKEQGYLVDFIPEQARFYIAAEKSLHGDDFRLTDKDQYEIMSRQAKVETYMKKACQGRSIIISDSSPLNALLYMSEEQKQTPEVQALAQAARDNADMIFYSAPLETFREGDPNRLHDREESLLIDQKIPVLCEEYDFKFTAKLEGLPQKRMMTLVTALMSELMKR